MEDRKSRSGAAYPTCLGPGHSLPSGFSVTKDNWSSLVIHCKYGLVSEEPAEISLERLALVVQSSSLLEML